MSRLPVPAVLVRRVGGPVLYRLAQLAGGPPPGLRRGRDLAPADVPVVVVVVTHVDEESALRVLDAVGRALWATDAFTPVFLVDAPVLAPFRRAGHVVELVGPRGLPACVAEVRTSYAADLVLGVGPGPDLAWLEDLLLGVAPGPSSLLGRGRRRLRRLEQWVVRASSR